MADRSTFEAQLGEAFMSYVADAPVDVDPHRVAAAVGAAVAQHGRRRRLGSERARLLLPIAAAFVLVSVIGTVAFVGSDRAPRPILQSPLPSSSSPLASPLASPVVSLGSIVPAPDMSIGRRAPVAVTLADGRVLVVGGVDQTQGQAKISADVFDPATSRFTPIAGDGPTGDGGGSAALLPNGRALVINHNLNETASRAFIFDPATMGFRRLAADRPANAPIFGVDPSLALLNDGRVLIAGGQADVYKPALLASAHLFDPATETLTATGSMSVPRYRHSMTTLRDGRVLITGGEGRIDFEPATGDGVPPNDLASGELYDPATGTFTPIGSMSKVRGATLAVLLPNGQVVVMPQWAPFTELRVLMGQEAPFKKDQPVPTEIFDPTSGAFVAGTPLPRAASSTTLLPGGEILLTGGIGQPASGDVLGTWAAVHDLSAGTTQPAAAPRAWFAASAAVGDGRVLYFGGMRPSEDGWPGLAVPWVDLYR